MLCILFKIEYFIPAQTMYYSLHLKLLHVSMCLSFVAHLPHLPQYGHMSDRNM
jgi:hypothetical protein